jgi:diadenosine hexaphosphate hydrolase (ATP-forming)
MRKRKSNDRKGRVRVEHSAGGVVFRRVGGKVLIGLIMDSYHKWTFPKGHVEKNEDPSAAAVRETREEMGLARLRLIKPLGMTVIRFKDRFDQPGTIIHKDIVYYLMEAAPGDTGKAENKKSGERVRAVRWVPVARVCRAVSYKNMAHIVKMALSHFDGSAKYLIQGR